MAYQKNPTWKDKPSEDTPITAAALNRIEDGIEAAAETADAAATLPIGISDVTGLQSELNSKLESPIGISDVTGLQSGLDGKASTAALGQKADESALTAHTGNAAIHVPTTGTTGHVLKKTSNGAEFSAETNTTYQTGTLAQLEAGTDTTGRLWSAKDIADYVAAKISEIEP